MFIAFVLVRRYGIDNHVLNKYYGTPSYFNNRV